jgi:hypothetical protein
MPVNDTVKSEGTETAASFFAMQKAPLFMRPVSALLPGAAKARKEVFGIDIGDAIPQWP